MSYNVAVVGAGMVGKELVRVLKERKFPINDLKILATRERDEDIYGETYHVLKISDEEFDGVQISLFAGREGEKGASKQFGFKAIEKGVVVIDNASTFRMYPDIPLIVPEVNPHRLTKEARFYANPNCSTIQLVVALAPLHRAARIRRIVVCTYQSVSGWGRAAVAELRKQTPQALTGERVEVNTSIIPYQIALNVVPQIDSFLEDGYTKEELKMKQEMRKIIEDDNIQISTTTVRVPVFIGHAEAVNVEFEDRLTADEARTILSNPEQSPGVMVMDDPANKIYPTPLDAVGRDEVFVGRIREDRSVAHGLNMWIVADNLRKGAATNAVQIAEMLVEKGLI